MIRNASWQAKHERLIKIEQLAREALELAEVDLPGTRPLPTEPATCSALDRTSAGIRYSWQLHDWRGPAVNLLAQAAYAARTAREEHERAAS